MTNVVTPERLHERLRDAVALRGAAPAIQQRQAERRCRLAGLLGDVGGATVGQPLDRMWDRSCAEATLDAGNHQVADHLSRDARRGRQPHHDLAVAGVDGK